MDMAHQYAKLYLEVLSTSPTMNLPMFFEKYIIVPPFNNVPSYEQFKKKIIPLIHQLHKLQLRPIFKSAGYDCSVVEECSVIHSAYEENTDSELSVDPMRSTVVASSRVDTAYRCIRQATGSLGGNGSGGPIYGELTVGSMQNIINFLVTFCALNPLSRFLDVGAGLGKPNFHVAQDPGVCLSIGVEVEPIRWRVSLIHICFNLYLHLHSFNTLFMCIF
jgi:hypothetical protein